MHTNPIILTFCSILYYRDLGEHIRRHFKEKNKISKRILDNESYSVHMRSFTGILTEEIIKPGDIKIKNKKSQKSYNKTILNKWYLLLMLHYNKQLIRYRKSHIKKKKNKEKKSLISKLMCCSKKKDSNFPKSKWNLNTIDKTAFEEQVNI